MAEEIDLPELKRHLTKSTEEVLEGSEYLTREEAEELVDALVDEEAKPDDEPNGDSPDDVEEKAFSREELEAQLPDDVYESVMRHLEEPDSSFEKAMKALSGEGPDIPVVDKSGPTAPTDAALSRFDHHSDG